MTPRCSAWISRKMMVPLTKIGELRAVTGLGWRTGRRCDVGLAYLSLRYP